MDKNSPSSLLEVAAKGSTLALIGTITGKVLFLLIRVIITRFFGPRYFGLLIIAATVSEFTRIFASIGLPRGGMRFVSVSLGSNKPERLPGVFGTALLLPFFISIVLGSALLILSEVLSLSLFNNSELIPILKLFALSIPFSAVVKVSIDLSRGFNTTKYAVMTENLFIPMFSMILFFVFYFLDFGFNSIIYAVIGSNALGAIFILSLLHRQLYGIIGPSLNAMSFFKESLHLKEAREIIVYSIPLFLMGFTGIVMASTDVFMLGVFLDAAHVGVYSAASTFAVAFSSMLIMSVNSIFAPLVATQFGKGDIEKIRDLYIATTRWMFYITVPLVAFVILARKEIMLIFGRGFTVEGPTIFLILIIGSMANCFTGGVGQILSMTGHQKKELFINITGVVLNILLNLVLIPEFGVIGAAVATASSQSIVNAMRLLVVYRIFGFHPFTLKLLKFLFVGVAVVLFSFVIKTYLAFQNYDLSFGALALIMTFFSIFIIGLEQEDKKLLETLRGRLCGV